MAEQSGFFDAHLINGVYDRIYLADNFAKYFASFIGNGVFGGKSNELMVQQKQTANMSVRVLSGQGWINGYWYENTNEVSLTIDNADGVLNRIDLIVLRWDNSERVIRLAVKKGTPASIPSAPTLQRSADYYELKLAEITIDAGTTKITQADILDTRLNTAVCGLVHAVVDQLDSSELGIQLDEYISEFISEHNTWKEEVTTYVEDWIAEFQNTNNAWFSQFKTNSNSAVNTLITENQAKIDKLLSDGQTSIDNVVTEGTAKISKLITDGEAEIDDVVSAGTTNINKVVTDGQANIDKLISDKTTEIDGKVSEADALIERLEQTLADDVVDNINTRIDNTNTEVSTLKTKVGTLETDVSTLKTNAAKHALKSTRIDKTVTVAEWTAGSFELTSTAITATSLVELIPGNDITLVQLEALQAAQIVGGTQEAGKILIKCLGEKPTIEIPVIFIVRGDL